MEICVMCFVKKLPKKRSSQQQPALCRMYFLVFVFHLEIGVKLAGDVFEVELPDDHEFKFPNQENVDVISYIRIGGDFKLTSFKICQEMLTCRRELTIPPESTNH